MMIRAQLFGLVTGLLIGLVGWVTWSRDLAEPALMLCGIAIFLLNLRPQQSRQPSVNTATHR
ncbi:MAG TPA: hypothetical protein DEO43_07640 [Halieaceae bacterium]|jgi:hypothetical protein|nr:hypothetical protein [Halieaceae bacterium]